MRWSCGGAPPRLAWPRRRPVVAKELVDWGMEVPGPAFCGQWTTLYIGAAEMARGRGSGAGSRKWRGAVAFRVFAPTHIGCFLLYHLYPFSDFFFSKLIDSLLVGSNTRAAHGRYACFLCFWIFARHKVLERLPREVAPSGGFYPREATSLREAFILAKRQVLGRLSSSRSDKSSGGPLEVVSGISLERKIASRGILLKLSLYKRTP